MSKRSIIIVLIFVSIQVGGLIPSAPAASNPTLDGYALPWPAGDRHSIGGSWYGQGRHARTDRYALDWNLRYDTVLSIKRGVVVARHTGMKDPGWSACSNTGGYGNYVIIDHLDGVRSLYAHLRSVAVRVGERITQGTTLGVSGNTGSSCGPHLHFRLTYNGNAKIPAPMGGYRRFIDSHTRQYESRNRPNGLAPPPDPSPPLSIAVTSSLTVDAPTFTAGEAATFTFAARNRGEDRTDIDGFVVHIRTPDGAIETVPCPGSPSALETNRWFRCVATATMQRAGNYRAVANWRDRGGHWHSGSLGEAIQFDMDAPRLDLIGPIETSGDATTGNPLRFAFTFENPAQITLPIRLTYLRLVDAANDTFDIPCADGSNLELGPGARFACDVTRALPTAGTYTYAAAWLDARGIEHIDAGDAQQIHVVADALATPSRTMHLRVVGPGVIQTEPTSVECTTSCEREFPRGAVVTLRALSADGSVFSGWTGACGGTGTCTVRASHERWVTARFSATVY